MANTSILKQPLKKQEGALDTPRKISAEFFTYVNF